MNDTEVREYVRELTGITVDEMSDTALNAVIGSHADYIIKQPVYIYGGIGKAPYGFYADDFNIVDTNNKSISDFWVIDYKSGVINRENFTGTVLATGTFYDLNRAAATALRITAASTSSGSSSGIRKVTDQGTTIEYQDSSGGSWLGLADSLEAMGFVINAGSSRSDMY